DRADRTDEPLERRSVFGFDFQHEGVLTGDVMAFEDVVEQRDGFLEQRNCFWMRDRHADERGDVLAEAGRVDGGVVADNNSTVFEFFYALVDRRRREPDLFTELDERNPAVLLQETDNLQVDGIEFEGIPAEFHKVILVE